MKEAFEVRRASAADAAGILQCLAAAFESYRRSYTAGAFADTVLDQDTLEARSRVMTLFVADASAGNVVGTIGCQASGDEGHLRGMAVLPEWQSRGVAEHLLAAAEQALRAEGCNRITLDTTEPLRRAIRFYQKHGYRESGKVQDFFGMRLYEYVKVL